MILKFENSYGIERVIAEVSSEKDAFRAIHKFLLKHKFKSYYTRTICVDPNHRMYDVGSHTEFFHLYSDDGFES